METLDAQTFLVYAKIAASVVRRRFFDVIVWTRDDYDDCVQAGALGAWIAYCQAQERNDVTNIDAYCQRAAIRAATRWLFRECIGQSAKPSYSDDLIEVRASDTPLHRSSLLTPDRALLLRRLLSFRKRDGEDEAELDVAILRDILDGVPFARIAEKHGLTPQALRMRRQRLRQRIQRAVEILKRWE